MLPNRRITLSIYTTSLSESKGESDHLDIRDSEPLFRSVFTTNPQGHFAQSLVIPWETLCTHPPTLPFLFSNESGAVPEKWALEVVAELQADDETRLSGRQTPREVDSDVEVTPLPKAGQNETPSHSSSDGSLGTANSQASFDDRSEETLSPSHPLPLTSRTVLRVSEPGGVRVLSDLVGNMASAECR